MSETQAVKGLAAVAEEIVLLPVDAIAPSPTNPRKRFDEAALQQLADSIREIGVRSPIIVRPLPIGGRPDLPLCTHELVAGERRWRGSKLAGAATVRAIVEDLSDREVLEIQIVENSQREDVHPLEEADAFARFIATGLYGEGAEAVRAIAEKIGRTAEFVAGRIELAKLIPDAREKFYDARLTLGHARLLASLSEDSQKSALRELTVGSEYRGGKTVKVELKEPALSVTAFRARCLVYSRELVNAPFDREDATLVPRGACSTCPFRTGVATLFGAEEGKGDRCLDQKCWEAKTKATTLRAIEAARVEHGEDLMLIGEKSAFPKGFKGKIHSPYGIDTSHQPKDGYVVAYSIDWRGNGKIVYARVRPDRNDESYAAQEAKRRADVAAELAIRDAVASELVEKVAAATEALDQMALLRTVLGWMIAEAPTRIENFAKTFFGMDSGDGWDFALPIWTRTNLLKLAAILIVVEEQNTHLYNKPFTPMKRSAAIADACGLDFGKMRSAATKAAKKGGSVGD